MGTAERCLVRKRQGDRATESTGRQGCVWGGPAWDTGATHGPTPQARRSSVKPGPKDKPITAIYPHRTELVLSPLEKAGASLKPSSPDPPPCLLLPYPKAPEPSPEAPQSVTHCGSSKCQAVTGRAGQDCVEAADTRPAASPLATASLCGWGPAAPGTSLRAQPPFPPGSSTASHISRALSGTLRKTAGRVSCFLEMPTRLTHEASGSLP